jgi:polyhydroxybutyrate depolymerase
MKRPFVKLVASLLSLIALTQSALANHTLPFPDMDRSWYGYQESVEYLMKKNAISGYPDGTFKPKTTINRAEFLKLVFTSRTDTEPVSGDCFTDVPIDIWYAPFVCAAKRRGVVNGYKVGSRYIFRGDQPITYAEALKMAMLTYGHEVPLSTQEHWFVPYVKAADDMQVLPKSSYIPWEPIPRERAADVIARFIKFEEDRELAKFSPGCGKSARGPQTTLTVNDVERTYIVDQPQSYTIHDPYPLIIAFHGRTNSNEQVLNYFNLDREAKNYFVAYPAALPNGNGFTWTEKNDVPFFDAIVHELANNYCIDMDRIFVVGHSLGAYFANTVACVRGGVVRASATVGGSTLTKNCSGPTAAMIINNPNDTLSPQATSEQMRDIRLAVNKCSSVNKSVEPNYLNCVEYQGCSNYPVVFCPHTISNGRAGSDYPHIWPDGVAGEMVRFFGRI